MKPSFFYFLLPLLLFASCSKKAEVTQKIPTVQVALPLRQMVTKYDDNTGTVAATQQVNIVARVEGYLESINFNDGQQVEKGALLFIIQQQSYIEDVKRAQALLDYDSSEYQRQLGMLKENATSQAEVEKYLSKVQVDQANLALAKLNLSYTEVRAPFKGLLGAHKIDIGNLVGNPVNPNVLVTIEEISPVYVNFNINMRDALTLRDELNKLGRGGKKVVGTLPVYVALSNEKGFPHEGVLDFVNNSLDTSTGTVQVRAIFPNEDLSLIPGFFVNVRVAIGPPFEALTVPNEIIQNDQVGEFLLALDENNIVKRCNIKTGPRKGNARAILEGITAEDRVIVAGLNQAKIGSPATIKASSDHDIMPTPTPAAPPSNKKTSLEELYRKLRNKVLRKAESFKKHREALYRNRRTTPRSHFKETLQLSPSSTPQEHKSQNPIGHQI